MASTVERLVSKVRELYEEYSAEDSPIRRAKFRGIKDILENIDTFSKVVTDVIALVEVASAAVDDLVSGEAKLDAAAEVIDDMVKLPWYFEVADGPLIKVVLSYAVNLLNKSGEGRLSPERARSILENPEG